MSTVLTSKGPVTIPKRIRDALHLDPGSKVDFAVNAQGEVVIHKRDASRINNRFEAVRGRADIPWRTEELMALLRGED